MDFTCPIPSNLRASTTSVPTPTTYHGIPLSYPPCLPLLDAPPTKRPRQSWSQLLSWVELQHFQCAT